MHKQREMWAKTFVLPHCWFTVTCVLTHWSDSLLFGSWSERSSWHQTVWIQSHLRFASISGRAERQLQNYRQSGQHHSEVRLRVVFNLNSLVVLMSVCCEQCSPLSPSRSEVSSSSSSEPPGRSGQQLSVQVLLHSQGLQVSQQDCEILSSQEDLFGTDKTGKNMHSHQVMFILHCAYNHTDSCWLWPPWCQPPRGLLQAFLLHISVSFLKNRRNQHTF